MYIFAYNKEKGDFGEDWNSWEILDWDEVIEARWLYVSSRVTPCSTRFGEEEGWQSDNWVMPRIGCCSKNTLDIKGKEIDLSTIKYKHKDSWENKPTAYYDDLKKHFENNPYKTKEGEDSKAFELTLSPRYVSSKNKKIKRVDPYVIRVRKGLDPEHWAFDEDLDEDLNELFKKQFPPTSTHIKQEKIAELFKINTITPTPIRESGGEYAEPYSFIQGVHAMTRVIDSAFMGDFLLDFLSKPEKTGHITVYVTEFDMFYNDFKNVLDNMGFRYVNERYASKLRSKEYSYFISARKTGKSEIIYNLKAKISAKTVIEFIDLNKILNQPKEKLISDYGEGIQTYSFACGHAIYSLNSFVSKATLTEKQNKSPMTITEYGKKILKGYGNYNAFTNLYDTWVPDNIDIYRYIDASYHGGYQYFDKEKYDIINKNKMYSGLDMVVLDVNSLYDYAMKYMPLPVDKGYYHTGKPFKYVEKELKRGTAAAFLRVNIDVKVKKDKVPTLSQPKFNYSDDPRTMLNFNMSENYIKETTGQIEVVLTYPDLLLLRENYDIKSIEYIDYIYFRAEKGTYFGKYIDKFYKLKSNSNGAVKRTAKLLLVTPYGYTCKKKTYFNIEGDDVVESDNKMSYLHIGAYISAWSRYKIVMDGLKFKKYWLYTDTDSLHLILDEQFIKELKYNKEKDKNWVFMDKGSVHVLPEKGTKKNYRDNGIPLGDELGEYKIEKRGYFNYFKNKVYVMNDELGFHITKAGADRHSMDKLEHLMNIINVDIKDSELCNTLSWIKGFEKTSKEYFDKDKVSEFVTYLCDAIENKNLKNLEDLKNIPIRFRHKTEPFKYSYGYRYEKFVNLPTDEYKYI